MRNLVKAIAVMLLFVGFASFFIAVDITDKGTPLFPAGAKVHPHLPHITSIIGDVDLDFTTSSGYEGVGFQNVGDDGREHAHIIFSTDCGAYQNWQSELLAFSAQRVGHRGPITRIASGCTPEEQEELGRRYEALDLAGLRVHFAEASKKMADGRAYKYFNKPSGLKHWLENDKRIRGNEVIALLDPDMILMKPFPADIDTEADNTRTFAPFWDLSNAPSRIVDGSPAAQNYGLGAKWVEFNRSYVCGEANSPCVTDFDENNSQDRRRAVAHYAVGPPYVATRNDFRVLSEKWVEFCPKLYEEYAALLTEMYAYCLAAAHLRMPHFMVFNWMVSEPGMENREGWPEIDSAAADPEFTCDASILTSHERMHLPNILHYCQKYIAGDAQIWSKHRIPTDIFSCDNQLLQPPPVNAMEYPPGTDNNGKLMSEKTWRRNAWMACYAYHAMNDALRRFKAANCGDTANLEESYLILKLNTDCKGNPNCHNK